ncbi:MAG: chloride channel protein [Bacteroides sp.]|nr:chloride channel protein [Bacteroides sp.]MCM1378714.1 chloride channel protein [Bacteroides sp.]MCM1444987.1 chloride channel protein [Prevotella sp.]
MMAKFRILFATVVAGIIIGGAAWAVKHLIALISRFAIQWFDADQSNWWMIILGLLSIVLTGYIVRHIVKHPLEHATVRIKADLASGQTLLPWKLTIAPLALNALTLGFGGSAGAEGPIAYSGAAISTRVANIFGISKDKLGVFLACGAGAGIAAIFKAPLGGVFFTLELLGFALTVPQVILLVIMCLIAGLSAYAFGDCRPDMFFTTIDPFGWKWYLPATILGLVCGLYSIYYNSVGRFTMRKLRSIKKPAIRNIIAGGILGICLFIFPSLYGEGYGVLGEVLNGNINVMAEGTLLPKLSDTPLIALVLGGILLVKSIATYATNSGGGVAGEFAPTIFAGGMLGALFSIIAITVPVWSLLPVGDFIVLAMAAVMAGTIQAPLMAIFIVVEMTMKLELLLPICLTSVISFGITKYLKFAKAKQ